MKSRAAKILLLVVAITFPSQSADGFSIKMATPAPKVNCPELQSLVPYSLSGETSTPAFLVNMKVWNSSNCTLHVWSYSTIKCFVPILDMKDGYYTKKYTTENPFLTFAPKVTTVIPVTSMYKNEAENCRNYVPEEPGNYGTGFLVYGITQDVGSHRLKVMSVDLPAGAKIPVVKLKPCDKATIILGTTYRSQILSLTRLSESYNLDYQVAMNDYQDANVGGHDAAAKLALLEAQSAKSNYDKIISKRSSVSSKLDALLKKCSM